MVGRADIVEIINSRVPLKKAGREYRACCPFHDEKTPSFWVNPVKQFYHCFGCGAHGTVLSLPDELRPPALRGSGGGSGFAAGRGGAARGGHGQCRARGERRSLRGDGQGRHVLRRAAGQPPSARAPMRRSAASTPTSSRTSASAMRRIPGTKCSSASAPAMPRGRSSLKPASSSSARKAMASTTASATG